MNTRALVTLTGVAAGLTILAAVLTGTATKAPQPLPAADPTPTSPSGEASAVPGGWEWDNGRPIPAAGVAPEILAQDQLGGIVPEDRVWLVRAAEEGEQVVLAELQEQYDADPAQGDRCHQLAHELGRQAYVRHDDVDTALAGATTYCADGYIHGLFEGWGRIRPDEVPARIADVCDGFDPYMSCAHGLGHAIMQVNPDLEEAFALCDQLERKRVWDCVDGVTMLYSQAFLRPCGKGHCSEDALLGQSDDPYYGFDITEFCGNMPDSVAVECHFAAGFTWLGVVSSNLTTALEVCTLLEGHPDAPRRCAWGVGVAVPNQTGFDAPEIVKVCTSGPSELADDCVDGALEMLLPRAEQAELTGYCETWPEGYVDRCESGVSRTTLGWPEQS